jgi:hypothetical protein
MSVDVDATSLPLAWAIALQVSLNIVAALVIGPSLLRVGAAFAVSAVAMGLPFAAPPDLPVVRMILSLLGLLCVLRTVDIVRDRRQWSPAHRVWFFLTPFDTRRVTPVRPSIELPRLAAVIGYGALAAAGLVLLLRVEPRLEGAPRLALRWGAGALFFYCMVDSVTALIQLGYRSFGLRPPLFHDAPIRSRTLQEFWGERWNRAVHGWLEQHCFRPLARRRRPITGILLAFAVSTFIHVWMTLVGLDLPMALLMGSFFVVQGVLVLVELRLGVARWSAPAGRAWTIGWLLLTSPLFVEPIVRALPR